MDKLEKLLEEKKLDSLLVTNPYNIRHLCGFNGDHGRLFVTQGKKYLLPHPWDMDAAKLCKDVEIVEENVLQFLKDKAKGRMGVENLDLKLMQYRTLKDALSDVELVDLDSSIFDMRLIKTEEEIKKMEIAYSISETALDETINWFRDNPELRYDEKCFADLLNFRVASHGGVKPSFDTISAFKENSANPHARPTNKPLIDESGGFLKIDFGTTVAGYVSDMTRTIFIEGTQAGLTPQHEDIYNTVMEAFNLGMSLVKPGVNFLDIHKKVAKFIDSTKYKGKFIHSLGHSLGLEVHEHSYVEIGELEENMVLTMEPGIYVEGFGGVRIEDGFVVTKNGARSLNIFSKELIVL